MKEINAVDMYNGEDSVPLLDDFFLDDNIKDFVESHIDRCALNTNFVQNYPDFSNKIYAGEHYSSWALTIGFDSNNF